MIWFTSDWHLGHANIIRYCNRPFKNTHFMNKTIIQNYRDAVSDNDEVYHLGDLTLDSPSNFEKIKKLLKDLPGRKHFILGNHDRFKPFAYHNLGFESVHTVLNIPLPLPPTAEGLYDPRDPFLLVHDPSWASNPYKLCIAGHVHEKWRSKVTKTGAKVVNVGVDQWDFKPVSFAQVLDEFSALGQKLPNIT